MICKRKDDHTQRQIEEWNQIVDQQHKLCRDDKQRMPSHEDFVENRYDQSVLSLLIELRANNSRLCIVNSKTIRDSTLRPQVTPHLLPMKVRVKRKIQGLINKLTSIATEIDAKK